MALTKYRTERLEVPHEEGEWIEIKARLSHWDLMRSKQAKDEETLRKQLQAAELLPMVEKMLSGMADSGMGEEVREAMSEGMAQARSKARRAGQGGELETEQGTEFVALDALAVPELEAYDEWVLLEGAIVNWSYKGDGDLTAAVTFENIKELDPETVGWLVGEIGRRNLITRAQGEASAADSDRSLSTAASGHTS